MNWKIKSELANFEEQDREMQGLLAHLPAMARQSVDLTDAFWRRQQIGIRAAIATCPVPFRWSALAFGAALVVLIAAMLFKDGASVRSSPSPQQAENIADQQLLMKVEYTLQNDVPVALEPAALLAKEMEANANYSYSEGDQE